MLEIKSKFELCKICRHEYTSIHVEAMQGVRLSVCDTCLEAAKHNFIWICMNCGKVYIRNKKLVLARVKNRELKRAYIICEGMQIIQGIDMCIECDPEGVLLYVDMQGIPEC